MKALFLPVLLLVSLMTGVANAQPALYVEGTHYETLAKPVRTVDPNKVEVTEVFWYGCPHCHEFDPLLNSWASTLPADVVFVRSPVVWSAQAEVHAQIFYVEQALGVFEKTHKPVFDAIQQDLQQRKNLLVKQDELRNFFATQGVDPAAFDKAWTSFGVTSAVKQAATRTREYGVTGVPTMIVNGKYRITTGEAVPSHAAMLKVVDFLVAKERVKK